MIGQEIESCYSVTQYRQNPPETPPENPTTRPEEPHIECSDDSAGYSCEVVHISGQPILRKWTSEVSHDKGQYDESE